MRHTSCIFCLHLNCTASFYQKCLSTKNQFKNQNLKCKCNSKTRHIIFFQPIPFMSHLKTDFWSNKNRCYFSNSDKCFFLQERACHKNWISWKWCQWHTRIPSVTPEMRVMNFPSSKNLDLMIFKIIRLAIDLPFYGCFSKGENAKCVKQAKWQAKLVYLV